LIPHIWGWIAKADPTTIATALLAIIGWWQIQSLRKENKLDRTLTACVRYESDQVVEGAVKTLRVAWEAGNFVAADHAHAINMLLNYLDTVAIGIEQGVYDEKLAKDYLQGIVALQTGRYLNTMTMDAIKMRTTDYNHLEKMARTWAENRTLYQVRWWKRPWII
jgi:hypothetical protein